MATKEELQEKYKIAMIGKSFVRLWIFICILGVILSLIYVFLFGWSTQESICMALICITLLITSIKFVME